MRGVDAPVDSWRSLRRLALPNPQFLERGLRLSATTRNFGWLIADKVIRLFTGLVVGLIVARHLGPERFGMLNYVAAAVAIMLPLVELGIDQVARRMMITKPLEAGKLLATIVRLRLGAAAMIYLLLGAYCWSCGESQNRTLLLVLGLSLFQPAVFTPDIWLQANLRAQVAALANWAALLIGAAWRIGLVAHGADTVAFAWAAILELALAGLLLWGFARQSDLPRFSAGRLWETGGQLVRESWPILLSGVAVVIYMRVDVVIIRHLISEHEAGIYVASVRLAEAGYFIPVALASSLLPSLMQKRAEGEKSYRAAIQRYYDLSAVLGYAIALVTALAAHVIVPVLFGPAYVRAGEVLVWQAFAAVFVFMGVSRGQYLTNEGRQRFGLIATIVGAATSLVLNFALIPRYGAIGAAWAMIAAHGVSAWGTTWLHPELQGNAWMQTRALLIPFRCWTYISRR